MSNRGQSKLRILDIWFISAVAGFIFFLYSAVTAINAGVINISVENAVLFFFITFISFTCWLASKVQFAKQHPVKWLLAQTLMSIGGFIWYYIAIFRKRIANE